MLAKAAELEHSGITDVEPVRRTAKLPYYNPYPQQRPGLAPAPCEGESGSSWTPLN